MFIMTEDKNWYVCELRGVSFITWVHWKDKEYALNFGGSKEAVQKWTVALEKVTGLDLIWDFN